MIKPETILLFENDYFRSLYPFYLLHTQWEVRCGALRLFEKVQKEFPSAKLVFYTNRETYLNLFLKKFGIENNQIQQSNLLVLNSGILPEEKLWKNLNISYGEFIRQTTTTKSCVFVVNDVPIGFYITSDEMINPNEFDIKFYEILLRKYFEKLPKVSIPIPNVINFLWDAIELNSKAIEDDFRYFENQVDFDYLRAKNVAIINETNIKISNDCNIMPNVVLNAEKGPIIIDANVTIQPFSYIEGPVAICRNSVVKTGSFIYQGTSIGEVCKVGGEIENSIFHSYSNKQHLGFVGHSYIGEWCNLGAGTTTSDLKNTYETVSVRIENETFDTGRTFLGLILGDHSRTAINTSFNTGTITGICCNLYNSGLLSKYIPSFTWGGNKTQSTLGSFERTIRSIQAMMSRRGKSLFDEELKILELEYKVQQNKRKTN
ncbi:MAG: putative sugar nucleotidyl transferase [Ignavibacteria bacterium]|nr:putative sugar nucleotidyl transferase [Ignavibacteria bacterium]